jgi:hypothetical protein
MNDLPVEEKPPEPPEPLEITKLRLQLTYKVVIVGITGMVTAMLIAVLALRNQTDALETIVAIVGAVGTLIGTLAGVWAGHTAGAAGKEEADQSALYSQRLAGYWQSRAEIAERRLAGRPGPPEQGVRQEAMEA